MCTGPSACGRCLCLPCVLWALVSVSFGINLVASFAAVRPLDRFLSLAVGCHRASLSCDGVGRWRRRRGRSCGAGGLASQPARLSQPARQTDRVSQRERDRQTDRAEIQSDRQSDRQTERGRHRLARSLGNLPAFSARAGTLHARSEAPSSGRPAGPTTAGWYTARPAREHGVARAGYEVL